MSLSTLERTVYELFVTNWNDQDLRFAAVDVEDAATGKRLARFDSKALNDPLRLITTLRKGTGRLLPAWRTAIITMEVTLPLGASVPAAVRHRIEFESDPNLQLIRPAGSHVSSSMQSAVLASLCPAHSKNANYLHETLGRGVCLTEHSARLYSEHCHRGTS